MKNNGEERKIKTRLKIEKEIMIKDEKGLKKWEENHRKNNGNIKKSTK
jgi:hypothetical protein